jgi:hypothetical protein
VPITKQVILGTLVRDGGVVLRDVAVTLHNTGRRSRALFVAPVGVIRADDVLHVVTPGDAPRVLALHVDRDIRGRADVEGDQIDAKVLADIR